MSCTESLLWYLIANCFDHGKKVNPGIQLQAVLIVVKNLTKMYTARVAHPIRVCRIYVMLCMCITS